MLRKRNFIWLCYGSDGPVYIKDVSFWRWPAKGYKLVILIKARS